MNVQPPRHTTFQSLCLPVRAIHDLGPLDGQTNGLLALLRYFSKNNEFHIVQTRNHNMEEETHVNEAGGAQSKLPIRPRLIPPEALIRLGEVVAFGAGKYAENNWRRIPYEDHIDHALYHLFSLIDGDTTDDHLGHALTRLAFAVAMESTMPFDFKQYRDLPKKENQ